MNGGADVLVLADENPVRGYNLPLWFVDPPLGLSGKAFGFLVYLVTRPQNTRLSLDAMAEHFTDRKTAIASGLVELEEAGYLLRERLRKDGGTFAGWRWYVAFTPRFLNTAASDENTEIGKPEYGDDSPESGNRNTVTETHIRETGIRGRFTGIGKPEYGAIPAPAATIENQHKSPVNQSIEREITNRIVTGEYRFAAENQPATSSSLLLDTVSTVDSTVKVEEVVEDVAEKKPKAKRSDWRKLSAEQQHIWDHGWAKGYQLLNGITPSEPSLHACGQFKEVCKKMLAATEAYAKVSGRPAEEVAAAQLYSCFERAGLFSEWEQRNFFTRPALFASNFDTIRSTLKNAGKPKTAASVPRPELSPEEYARQQEAKRYQNAVARGFIRPGDPLPAEEPKPATPTPTTFGPPKRHEDFYDLIPDGE